jgi:predicted anti-sigma-YlaC factor YlaD
MDNMCPDKQFLSFYYDGELPSPWKEKMERHLETCPECRKRIGVYQRTSGFISGGVDAAVVEAAKARVWQRITERGLVREPSYTAPPRGRRRFLPPRVAQALTAAVAGAAVAVICVMLLATARGDGSGVIAAIGGSDENFTGVAVSSDYELNIPEIEPASNMQELLRYLENDDSSNIVIIKLPERKKFSRYGEPAFINAADYNRRSQN